MPANTPRSWEINLSKSISSFGFFHVEEIRHLCDHSPSTFIALKVVGREGYRWNSEQLKIPLVKGQ